MSDFAQFEEALKNASAAGDLGAAQNIAETMRRMMQRQSPTLGMPDPVQFGQQNMPASVKDTVKTEYGVGAQRLAGIGSAPALAGHALAQLGGADNGADIQNWKALQSATPNTQMGNMAGNAAMFGAMPAQAAGTGLAMAGAKALPRYGQVADMAATGGGIAAATTPGDATDRMLGGAMGTMGAAVPMAAAAGQTARRMSTQQGKQIGLAEQLRREVGSADTLLNDLEHKRYPTQGMGVKPSAAMLTREPTLEVMETGSRVRTPDLWSNFDRSNASARWQELERQAGTPKELEQLRGARDAITGPLREGALQATGGAIKVGAGTPYQSLVDKLESLTTGVNRPNNEVQTLVKYVKGELDKGVTPEQVYTIRKMLTDGIKAGPTSELSQAARAARPQRMEIIGAIDHFLNDLSSGQWNKYLETYKLSSPLISSRQSLQNMADSLRYGRPAGEVPASMGERPAPFTFGRLLEQHGTKQFGSKEIDQLIPQHRAMAEAIHGDLNSQAGVMQTRATLGSPTAGNLANAGRVNQITNGAIDAAGSAVPLVGGPVAASVKNSMARMNEESLARLMQDPAALAEALRKAQASEEFLARTGRAGAGASGAYRGNK